MQLENWYGTLSHREMGEWRKQISKEGKGGGGGGGGGGKWRKEMTRKVRMKGCEKNTRG